MAEKSYDRKREAADNSTTLAAVNNNQANVSSLINRDELTASLASPDQDYNRNNVGTFTRKKQALSGEEAELKLNF